MVSFLKIEKDGTIKEEQVTTFDELYKKCNLRKSQGFEKVSEFTDGTFTIELWGRTSGRVNIKNMYIFPVELDNTIYGTCALVSIANNKLCDIQTSQWDKLCEKYSNNNNNNIVKNIQEESESDNDSIIKESGKDNKISEIVSDLESNSDSSEYSDSELKEDDYLYSSEEEDDDEKEDEEEEEEEEEEDEKKDEKENEKEEDGENDS